MRIADKADKPKREGLYVFCFSMELLAYDGNPYNSQNNTVTSFSVLALRYKLSTITRQLSSINVIGMKLPSS